MFIYEEMEWSSEPFDSASSITLVMNKNELQMNSSCLDEIKGSLRSEQESLLLLNSEQSTLTNILSLYLGLSLCFQALYMLKSLLRKSQGQRRQVQPVRKMLLH